MIKKYPVYSLAALGLVIVGLIVLLLLGNTQDQETILVIGVLLANVPGLVAAFMAERSNSAIRNGVVQEKAKAGAAQALDEANVPQVMHNAVQNNEMYSRALLKLLDQTQPIKGTTDGPTV